ncbi:hypothetical protein HPB49_002252 [Dermacentor silvarum]|uniref:Uncharacterized protein n=1 Tax=Dermacentor silvarum TaxID=543639 RepID=A0ACB8C1R1_DERSI|nr:hypothetical protein HPB49_002252 [Dermacentor silvarum]
MAPRSSYTLLGYSRDLDWRPTRFVGPVPSVRVCSLCGLIPEATVQLPCAHVLCRLCFDGCLRQGGVCPIDGQGFARDDAEWISLSLESFMRRKVRCWNDVNGCDAVIEVSKIADHFSNECAFHATSCSRCGSTAEKALEQATVALELASAQKESLEADLKELKELLAQSFAVLTAMEKSSAEARTESSESCGKRRSVKHREGNGSLAKQLREGIGEVLRAWKDYQARRLNPHRSDSSESCSDKSEPSVAPQGPVPCSICHDWCVGSYAALKEVALRDGTADVPSSSGYFFGYRIEPMIRFKTHGSSLRMHFGLQVLRGENDQQLLWPFHHYVRLWLVVPSGDASSGLPLEIVPETVDGRLYARPAEGSRGNGPCLSAASVDLRALESGGYIEHDKLRLRFEVLP